jgi:hypothetical protein
MSSIDWEIEGCIRILNFVEYGTWKADAYRGIILKWTQGKWPVRKDWIELTQDLVQW